MAVGVNAWKERDPFEQDKLKLSELRRLQGSTRPDTSCFKCGDAGWCKHRPRPHGA